MKFRFIVSALMAGVLILPACARAAEDYSGFLKGLRERGYYDYALLYLEQAENDPATPEEFRTVINYEKAMTLMNSARRVTNPDVQNTQLDQALGYLKQFTTDHPEHPQAGQADTDRGNILLGKARVQIWQAQSPANQATKGTFQEQARAHITEARGIFQAAHDKHKANYEKFPSYVEQSTEKELYEQRAQAEVRFIRAQLDLAMCSYEEAQTFDADSGEYSKRLTDAAQEFQAIHEKYRSMVGGLYARVWEGKCYEEQGDIRKALGIYDELLSHPGTSETMQRLQDQVRQFRLICLNDDQRKDYQLVLLEANEWLATGRNRARTAVGLGIRWELTRAQETLGSDRTQPEADRDRMLRQALANAREINKYPGQYKDVSMFMIRRLQVALRGEEGDPEDFETAYALSRNLVKSIKDLQAKISAATTAEEKEKAREDLRLHLDETGRMLQLALALVNEDAALTDVNQARYLLSYVYYLTRDNYRSAILGEFVGRHFYETDSQTALDAAYLAMAAWVQAFNDAGVKADRTLEIERLARVGELIAAQWPDSTRANDARMTLGNIYSQQNRPAAAAAVYTAVPENSEQYAEAQLAAGQAYWSAYLAAYAKPAEERTATEDELKQWQSAAEQHLRSGVERTEAKTPAESKAPDALTAGKVSLAQILINTGNDEDALSLLNGDPHPVMQAVTVEEGAARPAAGVQSVEFAGLCYQLLLRGYVGTKQIDAALEAMQQLESVNPDGDSMDVYIQLGRELQMELKRSDAERQAEVRSAFEAFLDELYKRPNQSYGSRIWIAETYYGLATGMGENNPQAAPYFEKAAESYNAILTSDDKPEESKLIGIKLRLVNCRREQGKFDTAFQLVSEIVKAKPNALDAQFEAAYVLQDWGRSGQPGAEEKLQDATKGVKEAGVWGWGPTIFRLQQAVAAKPDDDLESRLAEARLNSIVCRHQLALSQSSNQRTDGLKQAQLGLENLVRVGTPIPDEWWDKFDGLYRQLQRDQGVNQPVSLSSVVPASVEPEPVVVADSNSTDETEETAETVPAAAPSEDGGPSIALIVVALLIAGGGGVGFVVMMGKKKPRRVANVLPDTAPVPAAKSRSQQRRRPAPTKTAAKTATGEAPASSAQRSQPVKKKKVVNPADTPPGEVRLKKKKKKKKRPAEPPAS